MEVPEEFKNRQKKILDVICLCVLLSVLLWCVYQVNEEEHRQMPQNAAGDRMLNPTWPISDSEKRARDEALKD